MTEIMIFALYATVAAALSVVGILFLPSASTAEGLARTFNAFTITVSLAGLLYTAVTLRSPTLFSINLNRVLFYRLGVVAGVAVASTVLAIARIGKVQTKPVDLFIRSGYVLKALCFSVALSFLTIEVGKLGHDAEMRGFFLQSGYPVWFMYAIMLAETVGSLALFFGKTMAVSATGLILILSGAVITHWRNHDPPSDSTDAVHLLILLICIVLLRLLPATSDPKGAVNAEQLRHL